MTAMLICNRCGERKESGRFRPGQPSHRILCLRCERTPVGVMPYPQTETDWCDKAGEAVNKPAT